MMKSLVMALGLTALLLGCAHVISPEGRMGAEGGPGFAEVRAAPDAFTGRTFIWGGFIVGNRRLDSGGAELEIVQNPIDGYGTIADPDTSLGRFILRSPRDLDPMIFEKGRSVTASGTLLGGRAAELDGMPYTYPVIEAREIYLWKEEPWPPLYYLHYYPPHYYPVTSGVITYPGWVFWP